MFEAIIKGALMGLMVSFSLGPVFFILIETSLREKFTKAFLFSLGAFISDVVMVVFLYEGTATWLADFTQKFWMRAVAGSTLILFGLGYILIRIRRQQVGFSGKQFLKGVLINAVNPGVPLFWLVVITLVHTDFGAYSDFARAFMISLFLVMFLLNILKILLSARIQKYLAPNVIRKIRLVTGIILIGFGSFIIIFPPQVTG